MRPDDTPLKRCTRCGDDLPATARFFGRDKSMKCGMNSRCRRCNRETSRQYVLENPGQHREAVRQWDTTHRPEKAANTRRWRAENPEKVAAMNNASRALRSVTGGSHTAADIAAQHARQKGRCYWCDEKVGRRYHVDHIVPLARGGSNDPENLVISCRFCNLSRGAKLPHEWGSRLC